MKLVNLVGSRFGRLTVLARSENVVAGRPRWHCRCECGGEKTTSSQQLKDGKATSCGCFWRERNAAASARRYQFGTANNNWRGQDASYSSLHKRVRKARGQPALCDVCGTTSARSYDWANLTGNYADLNDYKRMCRTCHRAYDAARRAFDEATK